MLQHPLPQEDHGLAITARFPQDNKDGLLVGKPDFLHPHHGIQVITTMEIGNTATLETGIERRLHRLEEQEQDGVVQPSHDLVMVIKTIDFRTTTKP